MELAVGEEAAVIEVATVTAVRWVSTVAGASCCGTDCSAAFGKIGHFGEVDAVILSAVVGFVAAVVVVVAD